MSLLTIGQAVADEVDIARPSSIIGNNNAEVKKILRFANKMGDVIMKVFPWQVLTKETTFTSVATEEQTSILASDFDRFVPETFWNRTDINFIAGPITAVEWQGLKADGYSDTENRKFRHRGDSVLIIPTMSSGKTLAFEYISANWCQSSGGTGQTSWAADDDTGVISEELLIRAVKWAYLNDEGLPMALTAAAEYESYFNTLRNNDQPDGGVIPAGDIFAGKAGSRRFTGTPTVSGSGGLF